MNDNAKMKLWEVCLHKPLFREELNKLVSRTNEYEIFEVLKYCYDKYSDMHADVLLEVFLNYRKQNSENNALPVEDKEPAKIWN